MGWSIDQITDFQKQNFKMLAEINATLRPNPNEKGKVGIFLPGQNGDLITATSVLAHRDIFAPGKEIIWFANAPNADALRYAPISEVRPWPWAGNGLPEGTPDFYPLLCNTENRLNLELAKNYELTTDLEDGYFPAPWMVSPENRHGIEYPLISKKIFNIPADRPWYPYLCFSKEEIEAADQFITSMGYGKRVLIETFAGSGQSILNENMIATAMGRCNEKWGACNFIFASHKFLNGKEDFPPNFFDSPGNFSCAAFTVRQTALIADRCDLMISVSSGITVAASCWQNISTPIIQFCGSHICSTRALAQGPFELVTADEKTLDAAKQEFYDKLEKLLNQYKQVSL